MRRQSATQVVLILVGLISGSITVVATPHIWNSPPEMLAIVCTLLISGGLLLTGAVWYSELNSETSRYIRLPAITLFLLGIGGILVGILTFRPLRPSITQGLRTILAGLLVLVGGGLAIAGWRWFHRQEMRYPLSVLATGLVFGLSYVLYNLVDESLAPIPTPVLLLIPVSAIILGLVVLYRFSQVEGC